MNNNRIKEVRLAKHKTQKNLATLLGVSDQAIAYYEKGLREPPLASWVKMADYLNVPVAYLQGVDDNQVVSEEEFSKIMRFTLSKSTPDNLKDNLNFLDGIHDSVREDKNIKESFNLILSIINKLSINDEEKKKLNNALNEIDDKKVLENLNFNIGIFLKILILGETGKDKFATEIFHRILRYINLYCLVDYGIATYDSEKQTIKINDDNKRKKK